VVCPLFLASLLLATQAATSAAPAVLSDEPTPEWRWGPIRYILKIREEEKYRGLKTEAERSAFIDNFWHALDPTPHTPFNETRDEFWRRVNLAQALYHDSTAPGWKTDRGKIYILLGPPHGIDLAGGSEIWTYRGLAIPNTPPEIRLVFGRSRSGQYNLSRYPARYTPLVRGKGGYLGDSPISLQFDLGSVQVIPGRILLPEAHVATQYFFPTLHPTDDYRTFRAADGSTLLILDLALDSHEIISPDTTTPTDLVLSGSFFRLGEVEPAGHFARALAPESAGSYRVRFDLPPGGYRAELMLLDPVSHHGAAFSRTWAVSDYRQALSISSLTLTRPPVKPADVGTAPSEVSPWQLPVISTFAPGQTLYLAYQIYNAPGIGQQPGLDVEYRFFLVQKEKELLVGAPVLHHSVHNETLGYSLPLAGWPAGEYRIQVMVSDPVTESSSFREASFHIAGAPESPAVRQP